MEAWRPARQCTFVPCYAPAVMPSVEESESPPTDLRTIAELPFYMMGRFPKPLTVGRCRGDQIDGLSSKAVFERIRDMSLGLSALGMAPGERVAIVSESRPEWILCDLATLAAGAVTVPIYPTLSAAQMRFILQDSRARLAVVSTLEQFDKLQEVRHLLPALEAVVIIDAADGHAGSALPLQEVEARGHARMTGEWGAGREFREAARRVRPGDLATIIYTSGTTGVPKGVMLTHANLAANLEAGSQVIPLSQEDVALSFLPLSHAFERMVSFIYLFTGVTVIFAESMDTVARDIGAVRPTVLTGVPRVYEKMQTRIVATGEAAPGPRALIFKWSVRAGVARARAHLTGRPPGAIVSAKAAIADRLVFSTIRNRLGGRIRFLVSGSAPLSAGVLEFFYGIGLPIVEGYGLTETAPILAVNPRSAPRIGTVGRALPGVELRIAPDGEILARGPNIMIGYLNNPDATAEVLKDGWFATGDIGTLDAEGYLTITDRKKDLLVTSGGKKIAPQPIEHVLKRSLLVAEAVVLGDRRRYATALIVPEFAALERRLQALGRPPGTREELVTRPDVMALYQEVVDALNRDLSPFERLKRVALLPSEFTIESGELTPTLKVRRRLVEERWSERIDALYTD
jgi:long-chain acyl-CoA synthetase